MLAVTLAGGLTDCLSPFSTLPRTSLTDPRDLTHFLTSGATGQHHHLQHECDHKATACHSSATEVLGNDGLEGGDVYGQMLLCWPCLLSDVQET